MTEAMSRPPSPFEILLDFEQRSLAHAPGAPEQLEAPGLWRGIAYRLGEVFLVTPLEEITEILRMPSLTSVPATKAWLLGIANVRGNLLCVVHLRGFLEGEPFKATNSTRILVVKQMNSTVGLVVDEVIGQRSFVDDMKLEQRMYLDSPISRFLSAEYQQGQVTWGAVSLSTLAKTPEFLQAAA